MVSLADRAAAGARRGGAAADRRLVGAVTFRTIFFLPYILADVAAGLIWRYMFDGDYGLVSHICDVGWASRRSICWPARTFAFIAVLSSIVWKYFGFHMMLYIGGMQGIDRSLYEAAEIDGANRLAALSFRHAARPRADDPPVDLLLPSSVRCRSST